VIVTTDGYIITNKHVVENSTNLKVVLADGTTYEKVKIAAEDPLNDIAYLKIDGANNLVVAELGDSKALNIGQEVVAIGNALGQYAGTVTQGIVSGLNRTVRAASSSKNSVETLSDMIQTDAAINSGNSGGPLVNAKGQVIGINTAVASEAQGIGFAIPISATKGMLKSLVATGRAGRASLGVSYTSITVSLAKENNLPVNAGAWLYTRGGSSVVRSGSAADKAGLREKDIIVAVNGVKIGSAGSVSSLVGEYQPGETVKLSVVRDGRSIELTATLDTFLID
jgi:S1-C subfamily serine protease